MHIDSSSSYRFDRICFKLFCSLEKSANFIHWQFTTKYNQKAQGSDFRGESTALSYSPNIMVPYTFILLLPRFHLTLTGLGVHAREEYRAMAETTLSLHVDIVLSDMAATSEQWHSVSILH